MNVSGGLNHSADGRGAGQQLDESARASSVDARAMGAGVESVHPLHLGPMPAGKAMHTLDERVVRAPLQTIFQIARDVARWPDHLAHYRYVRHLTRAADGGGIVDMAAYRPFGPVGWPTWWRSEMSVDEAAPTIRFRHIGGITRGMDVEWSFEAAPEGTHVRILHVWDGPTWPGIGRLAATAIIGPIFIHGIASRTLAGLAGAAERGITS